MRRVFFIILFLSAFYNHDAMALNGEIYLHGELVEDPCIINMASATQTVTFGNVIKKMLYLHQRSQGYRFVIQLDECDISLGNQVAIMFNGLEDKKQPGLIATQGMAEGIAIGLEDKSGEPIAINKINFRYPLHHGTNILTFFAYISSSTEDIEKQTIVDGDFSATVTLGISYP